MGNQDKDIIEYPEWYLILKELFEKQKIDSKKFKDWNHGYSMTNKFDRVKLSKDIIKIIKKNKYSFEEFATELLLEIIAEQDALKRVLSKKKIVHPKELNTETQRVKKVLVRKMKKLVKHFEK